MKNSVKIKAYRHYLPQSFFLAVGIRHYETLPTYWTLDFCLYVFNHCFALTIYNVKKA